MKKELAWKIAVSIMRKKGVSNQKAAAERHKIHHYPALRCTLNEVQMRKMFMIWSDGGCSEAEVKKIFNAIYEIHESVHTTLDKLHAPRSAYQQKIFA